MNILFKIKKIVDAMITALAIILMSSIVLFTFAQVILRNFFTIHLTELENIVRSEVLWIAFIGAVLTSLRGRHISIDILPRYLKGKARKVLLIVLDISAMIICFILAWYSIKFIQLEISLGTTIGMNIPAWIPELILPIGFFLLAISFPLKLVKPPEEEQIEKDINTKPVDVR
ncbi:MAG: TRAP transporter small permease [Candidatus Marinimicrobia bacterium]|nr:TRAP transporter small permease [Candidatus Neomarinimicrobiota bacterium]